jgi:CHAD domain-containing protein
VAQETAIYTLDSVDKLSNWAERFAIVTNAQILSNHEEVVELTYLDSFDWLFYSAGVQLRAESSSGVDGKKIILRWLSDGSSLRPPAALPLDRLPKTAADLPAGQIHDLVNKQLELRSLIPMASVRSRQIKLAIFDKESKTRCRLILEHNYARPGGGRRSIDLDCRLRLEALLGYEKVFSKTAKLLGKLEGVTRTKDDVFENAVKASGRIPGDYFSKIKTNLKCDWRVDKACRLILLDQLDQLEWNIEGIIANIDTEFLHDLRVAIRRSRALLNRVKNAFPISVYKRFSKELAWVGESTTPLRDLDVFLLGFPKYLDSLRPELRTNLMPFHDFLSAHHKTEQVILIKHLNSRRFKNFRTKWRAYLEKPLPKSPSAKLSTKPIGVVADIRIWKTYRRLIKEGFSITENSPATDIHNLRKTCKKLRYLLEFFSDLYSQKEIKETINELKNVQENLGEFQDLDVQASKINHFQDEMSEEGETRKNTFIAMDALIENMSMKKEHVRTEFDQRFLKFSSIGVEKEFRDLCGRVTPEKKKHNKKNDKTSRLTK